MSTPRNLLIAALLASVGPAFAASSIDLSVRGGDYTECLHPWPAQRRCH